MVVANLVIKVQLQQGVNAQLLPVIIMVVMKLKFTKEENAAEIVIGPRFMMAEYVPVNVNFQQFMMAVFVNQVQVIIVKIVALDLTMLHIPVQVVAKVIIAVMLQNAIARLTKKQACIKQVVNL